MDGKYVIIHNSYGDSTNPSAKLIPDVPDHPEQLVYVLKKHWCGACD